MCGVRTRSIITSVWFGSIVSPQSAVIECTVALWLLFIPSPHSDTPYRYHTPHPHAIPLPYTVPYAVPLLYIVLLRRTITVPRTSMPYLYAAPLLYTVPLLRTVTIRRTSTVPQHLSAQCQQSCGITTVPAYHYGVGIRLRA